MMEQEYRREMDRVELSPDQRARIVQAMVEESPRKKRRRPPMRLLAAAVLVCGALTTSALALSPTLRDYLAQALGSFTSYSQEPGGAVAVDDKVEVRVVSAVTDQYRMKIYVEAQDLTGEYFTDDRGIFYRRPHPHMVGGPAGVGEYERFFRALCHCLRPGDPHRPL